jgi:tyrosine phenol-lyase
MLISDGDFVPGNMYFTTTRLHQELAGGTFVDVIIDEAHDPESSHPFKGNIDFAKLDALVDEVGAEHIPYFCVATCVNMAGGQPISLCNLKQLRSWCDQHDVLLVHDMTRVAENAYFIQQREEGYRERSVREIVFEICSLTDIATMSAKKDAMVNIGGFLAMNDPTLYEQACALVVVYEGLHTYGGMAGRDMEALAIGITESVDDDHIRARVGQVEYLGEQLERAGIPIVTPIGGHAVFLDARRMLPHIPQERLPAQALAAALYLESGVRSMERGVVSAGRDKATGENHMPELELVRLTIPRRVYTQAHMDVTAESVVQVAERAEQIQGLRFTYEPDVLRFFQAKFEPV